MTKAKTDTDTTNKQPLKASVIVSYIQNELESAQAKFEKIKADFISGVDKNPAYAVENSGTAMLSVHCAYQQWYVLHELAVGAFRAYQDAQISMREIRNYVQEGIEEVLRNMRETGISSTSAMTNLAQSVKLYQKAQAYNDLNKRLTMWSDKYDVAQMVNDVWQAVN